MLVDRGGERQMSCAQIRQALAPARRRAVPVEAELFSQARVEIEKQAAVQLRLFTQAEQCLKASKNVRLQALWRSDKSQDKSDAICVHVIRK